MSPTRCRLYVALNRCIVLNQPSVARLSPVVPVSHPPYNRRRCCAAVVSTPGYTARRASVTVRAPRVRLVPPTRPRLTVPVHWLLCRIAVVAQAPKARARKAPTTVAGPSVIKSKGGRPPRLELIPKGAPTYTAADLPAMSTKQLVALFTKVRCRTCRTPFGTPFGHRGRARVMVPAGVCAPVRAAFD